MLQGVENSKPLTAVVAWYTSAIALTLLYMGAQWQHEIAMLCVTNGWPFGWPFSIIWPNPWQAMDFWRLLQDVLFLYFAGSAFLFLLLWYSVKVRASAGA